MIVLSKRLNIIFDRIEKCGVFADVGCDHGYIAYKMLEEGKCDRAIITDISAKCLKKADNLLKTRFAGKYEAIVADGLKGAPYADEVLIAGMGGEVIRDILYGVDHLPERLVLQPMKNPEKVRRAVVEKGYFVERDYTFKAGKFYDLIVAVKGRDEYSEEEYSFGRDNIREKGDAFIEQISNKIEKLKRARKTAAEENREDIEKRLCVLEEILK
ncbi:MAG: SAM-dependent methyltransferase [Clostridia bacterium]|nr:SAM-dependent methyltransferase [Clostridia bacterium]